MIKNHKPIPVICICGVGKTFAEEAESIVSSCKKLPIRFVILTDHTYLFKEFQNVEIIGYHKSIFSYHDKIFPVCYALYKYKSFFLIDSDHKINVESLLTNLEKLNLDTIENCAYVKKFWKNNLQVFLSGQDPFIPYGNKLNDYCISHNLETKNVVHIQESFLFVKETNIDKINKFCSTWHDLKKICENNDTLKHGRCLGYGEGFSIAIALYNSGIFFKDLDIIKDISCCFDHEYPEQFHKR